MRVGSELLPSDQLVLAPKMFRALRTKKLWRHFDRSDADPTAEEKPPTFVNLIRNVTVELFTNRYGK